MLDVDDEDLYAARLSDGDSLSLCDLLRYLQTRTLAYRHGYN